jgi:shikimate kinase
MPQVILIGLPGAGKSTVARALSKITGLSMTDTDQVIESRAGKKISEIFSIDGEAAFRALESQIVQEELARESGVLALGGGSIVDPVNQELIAESGAAIVYLEISGFQASVRVGKNSDRPMLVGDAREKLARLATERSPIYQSLATITVKTASKKPSEVALEIARLTGLEALSHG